jgi:Integrase core domain
MHKLHLLKLRWPNMRLDIKTFIRECPCCQKMSQIKGIQACKFVTSTYRPMECLNIDFTEPHPDKGYVLVIIDCFTGWVELYAVPEATAHEACLYLIQHFGRYGSPTIIIFDKGSHFANELIAQFLAATGTLQNLTVAHSSQETQLLKEIIKNLIDTYVR